MTDREMPMPEEINFAMIAGSLPRTDGILNLSPAEAYGFLRAGAMLVDLREPYETNYRVFDVDEVLYVAWTSFLSGYAHVPRGRALILADASGIYCRAAARILTEAGYVNVAKLSGGMIDWDADGLPVRKDDGYERGGQCACKMKTRDGINPLMRKGDR